MKFENEISKVLQTIDEEVVDNQPVAGQQQFQQDQSQQGQQPQQGQEPNEVEFIQFIASQTAEELQALGYDSNDPFVTGGQAMMAYKANKEAQGGTGDDVQQTGQQVQSGAAPVPGVASNPSTSSASPVTQAPAGV